ncbi:Os1348 family NHLP clan protein [Kitasatospora sp. NPDC002227]|uniref:Os1348 family NHLP clan protein n=1 Tax=Kitasatospora sp. NPDC002227 TaxID=3154773 RepID=UPI0033267F99
MAEVPMLSAESKARVEAVLGRAASDTEFRQMLTSNPAAALADTNLTGQEREMLASMKRVALEEWGVEVRTFRNFILDDGFDDLDDAPSQI